jgi:hypothetical protein
MGTLVSSASVHIVQGISVLFSENAIIHPCFSLVTQVALSVLINYFLNGIFEALSRFREWYDAYLCVQGSSSTLLINQGRWVSDGIIRRLSNAGMLRLLAL